MKRKVFVAVFSMALIAVALVCYFNYDGQSNVMSGGTLVSTQVDL